MNITKPNKQSEYIWVGSDEDKIKEGFCPPTLRYNFWTKERDIMDFLEIFYITEDNYIYLYSPITFENERNLKDFIDKGLVVKEIL